MKRFAILFTAAAALILVGCGDNVDLPQDERRPGSGVDAIDKLPGADDIPPGSPFPTSIKFETPGCTGAGQCESVTFCSDGTGVSSDPGIGDFFYGEDQGEVWAINGEAAYTFNYKPGRLTSGGLVLSPGAIDPGVCGTINTTVVLTPIQEGRIEQIETLDERANATR